MGKQQSTDPIKSIYNDLGLQQAGVGYDKFVEKFNSDANARKSVYNDLGFEKAGIDYETFETRLGLKKKAQENVSQNGIQTSGIGSQFSPSTSPLGFAQEANTPPLAPFDMSVDANPDVARKVRENELNKQLSQSNRLKEIQGIYDQAQGEGSVAKIQQAVDLAKEKPLSSTESMGNSFDNMVNRIKGSIPRLKIVSADIYDNVFGKELAKKIYEFEGRDINAVRNEAYGELEALAQQVKPTLGLTESLQNNDWKGLAAGTVNAITSLGSTAVPALATMGAGLFTEMTGDAIVDFNEAKAKRLGKSVEQLYKDDEADFAIPATIGALSGALELYGMKGVKNLITDKIKGQGYKKALLFFGETQKEGLTEFVQTGLEEANKALGEGYSAEEASKKAVDKMFSKQGLESYLQGVVGAGVAGGAGQVTKMVTSPKAKSDLNTELQSVNLMEMELQRPEISEASRTTIANQLNQSVSNMADIIEEDQKAEENLKPEQRKEVERINNDIAELDAVIQDPNVSQEVKDQIEAKREPLEKELEEVYKTVPETKGTPVKKGSDVAIDDTIELVNGKKGKVTKVEGNQVTMTMDNGATFMATPELVEMSVIKPTESIETTISPETDNVSTEVKETPVEAVVEQETKPIIDEAKQTPTQKVVTENISEKRTKEVLDKAKTDLEALKQVQNKPAKYKASVKRLTDAFKAGEINEQEFNDTKARFDDVIAESSPNVPKKETLTQEEIKSLDNELANQDLTTDDFIQYERARAIEDANNDAEAVQQPEDDGGTATGETKGSQKTQAEKIGGKNAVQKPSTESVDVRQSSQNGRGLGERNTQEQETAEKEEKRPRTEEVSVNEEKVKAIQEKRQSIKDRIAQKLKEQRGNLSSGIDPSLLSDFIELGSTYIEEGIVKASDFIKRFREDAKEMGVDETTISDEDITEVLNTINERAEKKATRLRNKDIAEKRNELGLEERTRPTRKSNQELVDEANTAIKDGYDVESLIDGIIEGRKEATDKEVVILKQYQLAKEDELIQIGDKIVEATEQGKGTPLQRLIEQRDMVIQDIQRAYEAGERTGTVSARALQARKIALMNDYSLAGMLIEKRKANGDQVLSEQQIEETTSEYRKIKKLNDDLQAKIDELQEQNRDLRSKKQIESLKTILAYEKRKLGRVQQRESIQSEIDKAKEALSQKLKEQRSTLSANPIPVNLIPDIAKLGKLYAQKGINTLEGIADAIYVDLKESIEGLKKEDVEEVLLNFDYDAQAREEKRLEGFKLRTAKRTQELRDRLNARDFSRRKVEPVVLDAEAKKLQEELRKAKFDWEHGLERDILARRTRLEKVRDAFTEIVNVPRSLMASLDYSAPLRQGLVLTVNNPTIAGKAFVEMFRQSWSQKRFDNWLADLRETPEYSVMKDAGLYIADHTSPKLSAKEEQFMSNLADKIPGIGRLIKGSERAYVSYLNKLRVDVFNQVATEFENEGKTIESDKKLYDALATYINTATGRGNLGSMEGSAQILNSTFFSPRLIASRIRLLTNWANPVWYANTPAPVRMMYLKDMAKTIAVGTTLLSLASLAGADVEDDPRSSDFGKIRIGDKRWDIWGGFQQFVRFFSQLATGQRKSTADKTIREINGEGFKGETRADLIINMFRSKLAPVPATAWNLAAGENMVGEEFTWKDVPKSFLPLLASDLYKSTEKDGIKGLLGSSVGIFGIGVQDYSKKEDKPKSMEEIRKELREQLKTLKEKK